MINFTRNAVGKVLARLVRDEDGQTIVEYGLVLFLSSIAVVTALGAFGAALAEELDGIVDVLASL